MSNEDTERVVQTVGVEEMNGIMRNVFNSMGMDKEGTLLMDSGEDVHVSKNPVDLDRDFNHFIIRYHYKGSSVGKIAPISAFLGHIKRKN